jgi:ABC-type lipoprotein release transport system permease subunit
MMILGLLGAILGLIVGAIVTVKLFEKLPINGG